MAEKLFVEKSIEIDAPANRVWDVLTKREYTDQWVHEFAANSSDLRMQFHIESDWKLGSPVLWKEEDGRSVVEGKVTAVVPEKLLRFTVIDVRGGDIGKRPPPSPEDGITYKLEEKYQKTILHVRQGDFSFLTDGARYHRMTSVVWDRVLPQVKDLAENAKLNTVSG